MNTRTTGATALLLALAVGLPVAGASSPSGDGADPTAAARLEETRLKMGKWIETQQILSREAKDWQQGREVLAGRVELMRKEVLALREKIAQAEASVAKGGEERAKRQSGQDRVDSITTGLAGVVTGLEAELRKVHATLPDPVRAKIAPLFQRIPEDAATTKIRVSERFQSVLGILGILDQAQTELSVQYEVRTLAGGTPAEVRVLYVGLAQAYFVSASGEAGIGRPSSDGWRWESSQSIAGDVLTALDILSGKHSPAFVPLPVTIR